MITNHKIQEGDYAGRDVASAPDRLTGTAAENKAIFDRLAKGVSVPKFNALIDELTQNGADKLVSSDTVKKIRINPDRALEVTYDNTVWETTASSGHVIVDPSGAPLPQRTRMKFTGSAVTDAGGVTVVAGIKGDKGDPTAVNGKTGGSITLTAADVGAVNPNLLINGDFQIWQRGTPINVPIDVGYFGYLADRWRTNYQNVIASKVENTSPAPCRYAMHNSSNDAQSDVHCYQILEEDDMRALLGKTVTLSFYAKAIGANTTIGLSIFGDGDSFNITSTWSLAKKTVTVPSAYDSNWFNRCVGFYSVDCPVGDGYEITAVKLELGSAATPFSPRPYGEELALCQRYYQQRTVNTISAMDLCPSMRISPTITAITGGYAYDAEIY